MTTPSSENIVQPKIGPLPKSRLFDNLPDLMSVDEVADFLGKNPRTILNWMATRSIPFVKNGNCNVVLKKSLLSWLEQKEVKPWQSPR